MAPINAFMEDADRLSAAQARLDSVINNASTESQAVDLSSLKSAFGASNDRGHEMPSISQIVEALNSSADHASDPNAPAYAHSAGGPLSMLKGIPMKYLHFDLDVRPPYYGTYTAPYTRVQARKLARNPFSRTRQDTNYDYDSEAEWEEPEEGEDLNSDGEDDLDDDAEDDMDGFLDDEEDDQVKRRLISGDLVPLSTGLCWEDTENIARLNDGSGAICTELRDFKMGILLGKLVYTSSLRHLLTWT
jgi:chromatin assembly factor 1 subunit A